VLIQADCLEYMKDVPDNHFSVACFSPPYAARKGEALFDARTDFAEHGKFIPYAQQLSRICTVWAVNFTQLVFDGHLLTFTEELAIALKQTYGGGELFDRWAMYKKTAKPARGNRALTNFEYVLLFAQKPWLVPDPMDSRTMTAFEASYERRETLVSEGSLGLTPYPSAIPRKVFQAYAVPGKSVLDPFCGSGTSLLVAKELGLDYVGVDIKPENIELCRKRGLS
jgi:DNA modification methylase